MGPRFGIRDMLLATALFAVAVSGFALALQSRRGYGEAVVLVAVSMAALGAGIGALFQQKTKGALAALAVVGVLLVFATLVWIND